MSGRSVLREDGVWRRSGVAYGTSKAELEGRVERTWEQIGALQSAVGFKAHQLIVKDSSMASSSFCEGCLYTLNISSIQLYFK